MTSCLVVFPRFVPLFVRPYLNPWALLTATSWDKNFDESSRRSWGWSLKTCVVNCVKNSGWLKSATVYGTSTPGRRRVIFLSSVLFKHKLCLISSLPSCLTFAITPSPLCVPDPSPGGADICLKESMSLADSLYNLQLVQDFCENNLNHCCHFTLEDMLYAHASIKVGRQRFWCWKSTCGKCYICNVDWVQDEGSVQGNKKCRDWKVVRSESCKEKLNNELSMFGSHRVVIVCVCDCFNGEIKIILLQWVLLFCQI